ncbi:hypothetical protein HCH54_000818, partial [Aspergillus fumigatus]
DDCFLYTHYPQHPAWIRFDSSSCNSSSARRRSEIKSNQFAAVTAEISILIAPLSSSPLILASDFPVHQADNLKQLSHKSAIINTVQGVAWAAETLTHHSSRG